MAMDIKRLRNFVTLAEAGSFRRASERLHLAQPALSVSIQKLEAELGTRLVDRGPAGVTLTPAGSAVLREARRLLFFEARVVAAARDAVFSTGGTLRIGFVGTTTFGMLQRLLPAYRASYPAVELKLQEAPSVSIIEQIEHGTLDLGLVRAPVMAATSVTLLALERERLIVALPKGHFLAKRDAIRLTDLAGEAFLMYAEGAASSLRALVMGACQRAGFVPRISQEATQVQTLLALVESGLGIAFVPSVMRRYASDVIAYREVLDIDQDSGMALSLAYMADAESPAAVRFREVALRVVGANATAS
jgi:DNA-binding transcriptional LysR family regulator